MTLASQHGRVVILTFMYSHCPDTCPMTAQKLRSILRGLGPEAKRVRVLIVSTDPLTDTTASARGFLAKHGEPSWDWLSGSYPKLRKVWAAYGIYATAPGPDSAAAPTHTAGMYLIDAHGTERAYLEDTLPAPQIAQELHIVLGDHHWRDGSGRGSGAGRDWLPGFRIRSAQGAAIDLRAYRGRPFIVNFWATWCTPCRSEMPALERAYRRYSPRIAILGIDEQEPLNEVTAFAKQYGITYAIGLDPNGVVSSVYDLNGTPTTFFINRAALSGPSCVGHSTPARCRLGLDPSPGSLGDSPAVLGGLSRWAGMAGWAWGHNRRRERARPHNHSGRVFGRENHAFWSTDRRGRRTRPEQLH